MVTNRLKDNKATSVTAATAAPSSFQQTGEYLRTKAGPYPKRPLTHKFGVGFFGREFDPLPELHKKKQSISF